MIRFREELMEMMAAGGWVFWGLMALAFGIAFSLLSISRSLRFEDAPGLPSSEWRKLLRNGEIDGPRFAQLLALLRGRELTSTLRTFDEMLFARARRRIPFAFILISTAPLLGLLGTVSGMLLTFRGMASSGVRPPVDIISEGISEALITTQTGLVIGVPAYIVCCLLQGQCERLSMHFHQVESALHQSSMEGGH